MIYIFSKYIVLKMLQKSHFKIIKVFRSTEFVCYLNFNVFFYQK